jgi:hypothetical protein
MRKSLRAADAPDRTELLANDAPESITVGLVLGQMGANIKRLEEAVRFLAASTESVRRPATFQLPVPESTTCHVELLDELINLDARIIRAVVDVRTIVNAMAIGDIQRK